MYHKPHKYNKRYVSGNRRIIRKDKAANEGSMEEKLAEDNDKYVYGIAGIAELFHCSLPTANRIKKSGRIKKAITQIGRKIVVDKKMALELAGQPTFHRRGA